MAGNSPQEQWLTTARKTARRYNWAWFFEKLSLPLLISGLLGAIAIMIARRELATVSWDLFAILAAGTLALITFSAWLLARRKFTSSQRALVHLEDALELNNSLTAARQGVAPWPPTTRAAADTTRWNWPRLLLPPLATVLLLSAAFLLPISAKSGEEASIPEEPASRQSLQASLDELAEDDTIAEEYLEEIQKKLDEMREQPSENWFDHSALEAADTLQKNHEQQLKELERDMTRAERSLNALQNHAESLNPENRERLLNEFEEALEKMGEGAMKPNPDLLKQLGKVDPQQLKNLTPEQLDQLRENMRQQAQKMKDANGNPNPNGDGSGPGDGDWLDELMQEGGSGQEGENGQGPGQGQAQRGPGTAPGVLGDKHDELSDGTMESLQSRDLSNTLPGDLLQLQEGEHDVDTSKVGPRDGGRVDNLGEGGDLIWKIAPDLAPAEKKALRDFFK